MHFLSLFVMLCSLVVSTNKRQIDFGSASSSILALGRMARVTLSRLSLLRVLVISAMISAIQCVGNEVKGNWPRGWNFKIQLICVCFPSLPMFTGVAFFMGAWKLCASLQGSGRQSEMTARNDSQEWQTSSGFTSHVTEAAGILQSWDANPGL